ncbi:hypothetical protein [Pontibacter cellulosilyticus]|uniref:Uncharacterized protein n=1 Tax=Pontibacter cellulosilyticus TaxID=1720253 RepID=A0A923N4E8_9BACT|nr:hypothetical protein [Pontibacter cellulosilyticus]MBC5991527.1 hypothetical protein [Pontibacter cellulosilyticus]
MISYELQQPVPSQAILARYLFVLLNYLLRECHVLLKVGGLILYSIPAKRKALIAA